MAPPEKREQKTEKRFDAKIQASETPMKEHITQQVDSLKTPVAWLIGILVAVIALIGIPLVVTYTAEPAWKRWFFSGADLIYLERRKTLMDFINVWVAE